MIVKHCMPGQERKASAEEIKKHERKSDKTPVVVIKFHGENDLYFYKEDWDNMGGYKGFLKEFCMSIRDIEKVEHKRIKSSQYPTREWP